jgi:hypothetical protein
MLIYSLNGEWRMEKLPKLVLFLNDKQPADVHQRGTKRMGVSEANREKKEANGGNI